MVVVGGEVNFTCRPLADGSPGIATWRVTIGQSSFPVSNGSNITGTSDSYLLGDNRDTMVLVDVRFLLDGSNVTCSGLDQGRSIIPVMAFPPAILSVVESSTSREWAGSCL